MPRASWPRKPRGCVLSTVAFIGGAGSPFEAAKAFGVNLDIPPALEPLPGPVIGNLMELWSRRVAR